MLNSGLLISAVKKRSKREVFDAITYDLLPTSECLRQS